MRGSCQHLVGVCEVRGTQDLHGRCGWPLESYVRGLKVLRKFGVVDESGVITSSKRRRSWCTFCSKCMLFIRLMKSGARSFCRLVGAVSDSQGMY